MLSSEQNAQVCDATKMIVVQKLGNKSFGTTQDSHRIHIRHHRHTSETFALMQDSHLFQ